MKQTGQWDNTLIVFSADHYLVGKGGFFVGAMHILCIVRDPEATPGQRYDGFVESIDLGPTVLEWLGVEADDRFQGWSLLAVVRGNGTDTLRPEIHYEFDYRSAARQLDPSTDMDRHLLWVIRDAEYKYVHFADERIPPLLFDLRNDPSEFESLASRLKHAHTVLDYCQRLLRWQ